MSGSVNQAVLHITEAQESLRGIRIDDEEVYTGLMAEIERLHVTALAARDHAPLPSLPDERIQQLAEKGEKARAKQIEAMRKEQQEKRIQRSQEEYRARITRGRAGGEGGASREGSSGSESPEG